MTVLFTNAYFTKDNKGRYEDHAEHCFSLMPKLGADLFMLVDDGSPEPPPMESFYVRLLPHIGRKTIRDFPGWWRSFFALIPFIEPMNITKLIYLESDARILSERMCKFIKGCDARWLAFFCPTYNFPETAIQVINDMSLYIEASALMSDTDRCPEVCFPFTHVMKVYKGDRYGEKRTPIPEDADYACQLCGKQ